MHSYTGNSAFTFCCILFKCIEGLGGWWKRSLQVIELIATWINQRCMHSTRGWNTIEPEQFQKEKNIDMTKKKTSSADRTLD